MTHPVSKDVQNTTDCFTIKNTSTYLAPPPVRCIIPNWITIKHKTQLSDLTVHKMYTVIAHLTHKNTNFDYC